MKSKCEGAGQGALFDPADRISAGFEQGGQTMIAQQVPGADRDKRLVAGREKVFDLRRPIGIAIAQQHLHQFGVGQNSATGQLRKPFGIAFQPGVCQRPDLALIIARFFQNRI